MFFVCDVFCVPLSPFEVVSVELFPLLSCNVHFQYSVACLQTKHKKSTGSTYTDSTYMRLSHVYQLPLRRDVRLSRSMLFGRTVSNRAPMWPSLSDSISLALYHGV